MNRKKNLLSGSLHYLITGFAAPFVFNLLFTSGLYLLFGFDVEKMLASISKSPYFLALAGWTISALAFYVGTLISTKILKKPATAKDLDNMVLNSSYIYFVTGLGFSSLSSSPVLESFISLSLSTVLFYLISKHFLFSRPKGSK